LWRALQGAPQLFQPPFLAAFAVTPAFDGSKGGRGGLGIGNGGHGCGRN